MKFAFFALPFALLAFSAQAAEEENCFPAQATYLLVDHSGQNLVVKLEGRDCKNLNVMLGRREGNGLQFDFDAPLVAGEGLKPFPLNPERVQYEFLWEERKVSIRVIEKEAEGSVCETRAYFGYDTYNDKDASFVLNFTKDCVENGKKTRTKGSHKLYNF